MKGWKDIKAVQFEFEFTSYVVCVHGLGKRDWACRRGHPPSEHGSVVVRMCTACPCTALKCSYLHGPYYTPNTSSLEGMRKIFEDQQKMNKQPSIVQLVTLISLERLLNR
jgi:hypothetical protein